MRVGCGLVIAALHSAIYSRSAGWHVVFLCRKRDDWRTSWALSVWPLPPALHLLDLGDAGDVDDLGHAGDLGLRLWPLF